MGFGQRKMKVWNTTFWLFSGPYGMRETKEFLRMLKKKMRQFGTRSNIG